MTEEKKVLLIGGALFFGVLSIGVLIGFRVGFNCGERSAFAKYDQVYKDARSDYMKMKDAYFVLKTDILKHANEKGVEL